MADYKGVYLTLLRASEQAINLLIAAQQECEERYLSSKELELAVFSFPAEDKKTIPE